MSNMWPILIGWSAIVLILTLPIVGIVRQQLVWPVIATITVSPYSLYLLGSPTFWWIGMAIPLLMLVTAISIRHSLLWLAWSSHVLLMGLIGWIAVMVMSE